MNHHISEASQPQNTHTSSQSIFPLCLRSLQAGVVERVGHIYTIDGVQFRLPDPSRLFARKK